MMEKSEIIKIAEDILEEKPSPHSECYNMCEELQTRLPFPSTILRTEFGEERVTHYVLSVDSKRIIGIENDAGHIYIDPSITQFNENNYQNGSVKVNLGNKEFIEKSIGGKIGFFPPDSEERQVWYH